MKRLYLSVLLPGTAAATFATGVLHRQGNLQLSWPLWLAAGALVVALVAGLWLAYARLLARWAGIPQEKALRLDLESWLPCTALPLCFLPTFAGVDRAAAYCAATVLTIALAFKAGALLYYRPAGLAELRARPHLVLALIAALGLVLRLSLIAANRFYGDEALYAHWGLLIASGKDVWLRTEIVDKPPVFFYTLALFFKLLGPTEVVARLPNIMASTSGIVVVYALARDLYNRQVATLAALTLALSPFDLLFAPTAFTDPLMVALALGSCLAALKGRYAAAGLLVGLAFLTKPTAVFFLPLLAYLAWVAASRGRGRAPQAATAKVGAWRGLSAGLAPVVGAGLLWDLAVRSGSPSVFEAGSVHYGGMRLVAPGEVVPRLVEWAGQLQYLTASRPLDALLLAGVPALVGCALWRRRARPGWPTDLALAGFCLLFLAAHTLLSFSAWDRYLLGLVPVVAILLARVVLLPLDLAPQGEAAGPRRVAYGLLLAALLAAAMLPPLAAARQGSLPVGSDHGQFEGIDQVAAYLKGNAAPDAALFHRLLGWHYAYYLFDAPYSLYYFPDTAYVLDLVRRLPPEQEKYVAFPAWADAGEMQATLQAGGWTLRDVYRTYGADGRLTFTVHRIERQGE